MGVLSGNIKSSVQKSLGLAFRPSSFVMTGVQRTEAIGAIEGQTTSPDSLIFTWKYKTFQTDAVSH